MRGIVTPEEFAELTNSMQEFPLDYPGSGQFLFGSTPSGQATATVTINIGLANAPHLLVAIRVCNSYAVPGATGDIVNTRLAAIRQSLIDSDQAIRVSLAQQNITAGFVHQRAFMGADPFAWHPLVVPFGFRGNNQIQIELRRLMSYPTFDDGNGPIFPTAHVVLKTTQFVSDLAPATGPGSTGRP